MKKINIAKPLSIVLSAAIILTALICIPVTAEASSGASAQVLENTPGKWVRDGNQWSFTEPDGANAVSKWVAYNNAWYYIKADGKMADDEWVRDGSSRYFIKQGGVMASNEWIKNDGTWYWFKAGGKMAASEWLEYKDAWYWLKADGKMASGETLVINGKTYSFYASGAWIAPREMTQRELQYALEVLRLTNLERAALGLAPLTADNIILNQAAILRAFELAEQFGHTRPDGRTHATAYVDMGGSESDLWRIWENGYWIWGTNNAAPDRAVNWWMNSPEHRDNILNPNHSQLGVGVYITTGNTRCIQLFYSN